MKEEDFKAKADMIRAKIANCSDRELAYFADSIYFTEFESITEHIKRLANAYDPKIPF